MAKTKGKTRWLAEEIEWGKEVAFHVGVGYVDDEWEDEEEEEEEVDEVGPLRIALLKELRGYVEIGATAANFIPEAAPDDVTALLQRAEGLVGQIENADLETLQGLGAAVAKIGTDKDAITKDIVLRQTERLSIRQAAEAATVPDAADPDEIEAITTAKGDVTGAVGALPFTSGALETARLAAEALTLAQAKVAESILLRAQTRETYREAARKLTTEGHLDDQKALLLLARSNFDKSLEGAATTDGNAKVKEALDALAKACGEVDQEMADLGGANGLTELSDAFGAGELRELIKEYGSPAALKAALTAIGGKDNLAKLSKLGTGAASVKKLCDDLGGAFLGELLSGGVKPDDVVKLQTTLGTDVDAFKALTKDGGFDGKPKAMMAVFLKGCGGDPRKFKDLCTGIKEEDRTKIKGLIETGGLGDAPDALGEVIATGCGGDATAFVQLGESFKDKASQDALTRMLNAGGLKGQKGGDGDIDAKCLATLLRDAAGPLPKDATPEQAAKHRADGLATMFKGMAESDCQNFKLTLTKGGLGTTPEALGHALGIGCGGTAAGVKAFATTFADPQNAAGLKQMLGDGGMKGKAPPLATGDVDPTCLGQLLKHGAGTPPGTDTQRMVKVATLLKGLDKADCESFNKLLSEGGLGQAPEAMAHLVGTGCTGEAAKLKTVNTAFAAKDRREGLARMLETGGLKGKTDTVSGQIKVDTTCLANLLLEGAGDPTSTNLANENTRRAEGLGKFCGGMDLVACQNLGKSLETGGLGAEPKVLGKLLGTGCDRGDPVKFNALTAQLATSDNNTRLASLLQTGGFGTKGADGKDLTPPGDLPKPECLALLFSPGCNDSPAELTKLLQKLDPTKCANLKGVMMTGALGQSPKVLGDLYRNGCLDDPNGLANGSGAKNPDILLNMVATFSGTEAAKFKDLMNNANMKKFDDAKGTSRLGSVMRYAFTQRGAKQKPEDLKKLHTGFNGHMDNLDTMMTRMETAPDWMLENTKNKEPNQPGKALQNIRNSPKHLALNDSGKLYSEFFQPMEAYNPISTGATKEILMQTAASFEHKVTTTGTVSMNPGNSGSVNVDLGHVLKRHSRESNTFIFNPNPPIPNVTLYQRTDKEPQIRSKVEAAIGSIIPRQRPATVDDLNPNGGMQFVQTVGSDTHVIGYKRDPVRSGLRRDAPNRAMVGQCYPRVATNGQKLNHLDMMQMKGVLRND